jgi:hypothetical protein
MYRFADVEERLRTGAVTAADLVVKADANWGLVQQKAEVIMEERANDGQMGSAVERALIEFPDFNQVLRTGPCEDSAEDRRFKLKPQRLHVGFRRGPVLAQCVDC